MAGQGPSSEQSQVVVDQGTSRISDLWRQEDYWAIWLGALLLLIGAAIYLPNPPAGLSESIADANSTMAFEAQKAPFKTIQWYAAMDAKQALKASKSVTGKAIKHLTSKPKKWTTNPLQAFALGEADARLKLEKAQAKYDQAASAAEDAMSAATAAQSAAETAAYEDERLNQSAVAAIDTWRAAQQKAGKAKKKSKVRPYNKVFGYLGLLIAMGLFFGLGYGVMGGSVPAFMKGFAFVFVMALVAYTASSQATMKQYGIGYAAWAILFGLIISNTVGTPKWVMPAVQTEFYIKTGLVLLGAEILFGKILSIGLPGIFVAWVVTPFVLVVTFIFGQKVLRIPSKTLNMTISADMSVCGVSAAIATAAACRAKKEELTLSVGLSLVFTSIMMIVMPAVIKSYDIPLVLGGAWMGGTIDATGAVAAAGAFLGERALYVAATVKMIQNVMIGLIAFAVAVYWSAKVEAAETGVKVGWMEIWYRFPKFVLGFIAASIIFSTVYASMGPDVGYTMIDNGIIRGFTKTFRGWFFCLAFVSIGLATNFRELKSYFKGGKPLILYICGQSLNLALTLIMAYIMFYKVFPEITAKI